MKRPPGDSFIQYGAGSLALSPSTRWPGAREQRVGLRVHWPGVPLGPDRLLPPELGQDRGDDRLVRGRVVLGVQRPEHALAARLADQLVEQPVVDRLIVREPVVDGLGD